ncbi:MAG: hypothetical protein Q4E74_07700 [Ruminococcus sp.]|nr:hypothetical protein [Ruminococcus sp.]
MNKYTEKFAKLTDGQSTALAEAMNSAYNKPDTDNAEDKKVNQQKDE